MQKYLGLMALGEYLNCPTQKAFADKVHMTTTAVNNHWWAGGSSRPTLRTLEKISERTGMPIGTIVSKLYTKEETK